MDSILYYLVKIIYLLCSIIISFSFILVQYYLLFIDLFILIIIHYLTSFFLRYFASTFSLFTSIASVSVIYLFIVNNLRFR